MVPLRAVRFFRAETHRFLVALRRILPIEIGAMDQPPEGEQQQAMRQGYGKIVDHGLLPGLFLLDPALAAWG